MYFNIERDKKRERKSYGEKKKKVRISFVLNFSLTVSIVIFFFSNQTSDFDFHSIFNPRSKQEKLIFGRGKKARVSAEC